MSGPVFTADGKPLAIERGLLGVPRPRFAPGKWTGPIAYTASGLAVVNNRLYATELGELTEARAFSGIGSWVTIAGAAATVLRFGVYAFNPVTGVVGALLDDLGTVTGDVTGERPITIAKTYGPGWVALAGVAQGGTPTTYANTSLGIVPAPNAIGGSAGYYRDGVTGALPNPFGQVGEVVQTMRVTVRSA